MKMHLKGNKGLNGNRIYSACASVSKGNGKVNRNQRESYQNIPDSHILSLKDLKNIHTDEICSHCLNRGLQMRNGQRRRKGLQPVNHLFD